MFLEAKDGQPAHMADNLTAISEPTVNKNVEDSMSHKPMGLHSMLQG
jgi:hypothetical protein